MIPKKIHYCWFGNNPKNDKMLKCIESWKKFCPDYEIIEWNESNYNVNCMPYSAVAFRHNKFAHVTDYARLKIVYEHGGVYLDTDVELMAPLDKFLTDKAFFALQKAGEVATGLGFGAEAGTKVLCDLMANYEQKIYDENNKFPAETCVNTDKPVFFKMGLKNENTLQRLGDTVVYPTEYFNPKDFETEKINITKNTVSIHHYNRSWHDECEKVICAKYKELVHKYDHEEAKRRFGKWYKRNRPRLMLKRYGAIGSIKKVLTKVSAKNL